MQGFQRHNRYQGGDREDTMDVIYVVAPVIALTLYAALMAVTFG